MINDRAKKDGLAEIKKVRLSIFIFYFQPFIILLTAKKDCSFRKGAARDGFRTAEAP